MNLFRWNILIYAKTENSTKMSLSLRKHFLPLIWYCAFEKLSSIFLSFLTKALDSEITILCCRHGGKSYCYPDRYKLWKGRLCSEFAFTYVGFDYAAHVFVKKNLQWQKWYMCKARIVLVTFANIITFYFDFVLDCTSKCCVDVLQLSSICATPKILKSGNGLHFTSKGVQTFAVSDNIFQKFNIAEAPW